MTSRSCRRCGEPATASGTTIRRAPCSRAPQTSQTETSKTIECHCDHTWPGPTGKPTGNVSNSWVTLRWVTATPFGAPVVPEV
ncbi:Uncharacterised protein [Mycobacteroides abscessus subsp. abscessus]|nr:Uncharacterised protein [Mycobacteroides abscessus subsp. abscessus]